MKKIFVFGIAVLLVSTNLAAQSKSEKAVLEKVQELNKAVFETKDSAAIEALVSDDLIYGHSGGNVESKAAMIRNASRNKTIYEDINMGEAITTVKDKTAFMRFTFTAMQTIDGKKSLLKLGILQVWMKERRTWRLVGRQAVKIEVK